MFKPWNYLCALCVLAFAQFHVIGQVTYRFKNNSSTTQYRFFGKTSTDNGVTWLQRVTVDIPALGTTTYTDPPTVSGTRLYKAEFGTYTGGVYTKVGDCYLSGHYGDSSFIVYTKVGSGPYDAPDSPNYFEGGGTVPTDYRFDARIENKTDFDIGLSVSAMVDSCSQAGWGLTFDGMTGPGSLMVTIPSGQTKWVSARNLKKLFNACTGGQSSGQAPFAGSLDVYKGGEFFGILVGFPATAGTVWTLEGNTPSKPLYTFEVGGTTSKTAGIFDNPSDTTALDKQTFQEGANAQFNATKAGFETVAGAVKNNTEAQNQNSVAEQGLLAGIQSKLDAEKTVLDNILTSENAQKTELQSQGTTLTDMDAVLGQIKASNSVQIAQGNQISNLLVNATNYLGIISTNQPAGDQQLVGISNLLVGATNYLGQIAGSTNGPGGTGGGIITNAFDAVSSTEVVQQNKDDWYQDGLDTMGGVSGNATILKGIDFGSAYPIDSEFWKVPLNVSMGLQRQADPDVLNFNPASQPEFVQFALFFRKLVVWITLLFYVRSAWLITDKWIQNFTTFTATGSPTLRAVEVGLTLPLRAFLLTLTMTLIATIPALFTSFMADGAFLAKLLSNPFTTSVVWLQQALAVADMFIPIIDIFTKAIFLVGYSMSVSVVGVAVSTALRGMGLGVVFVCLLSNIQAAQVNVQNLTGAILSDDLGHVYPAGETVLDLPVTNLNFTISNAVVVTVPIEEGGGFTFGAGGLTGSRISPNPGELFMKGFSVYGGLFLTGLVLFAILKKAVPSGGSKL